MADGPVGVRTFTGSPPQITFPLLLAGSVGALLIYSAIKGQNPAEILKTALTSANMGVAINPVKTGQASQGLSSGHNWDQGGTVPYTGAVSPLPQGTVGTTTKPI